MATNFHDSHTNGLCLYKIESCIQHGLDLSILSAFWNNVNKMVRLSVYSLVFKISYYLNDFGSVFWHFIYVDVLVDFVQYYVRCDHSILNPFRGVSTRKTAFQSEITMIDDNLF